MSKADFEAILNSPALAPPPGVHPNFIDGSSFKVQGLALIITTCVIVTIVVGIRIFIRIRFLRRLSLEDYLLLFAWLAYLAGYSTLAIMISQHNVGRHQWDMTVRELITYLYLFHAGVVMYSVVILPLKLSIIIQVLRAFVPAGIRNFTFWLSHSLIWLNILFYAISTLLVIFACQPTEKSYNPLITEGHCLNSVDVNISAAAFNSLSDLLLLILPQQVIWRLSLPRRTKWALSFAFLGGVLSLTSAVIRLFYLIDLNRTQDKTHYTGLVGVWSFPEITFGFLVACLPSLRGFIHFLRGLANTSAIKTIRTRWQTVFGGGKDANVYNLPSGSEQPLASQYQAHHHCPRPQQISDLEYYELVVRSGNSLMARAESSAEEAKSIVITKPASTHSPSSNHPL